METLLILATHNAGKRAEVARALANAPFLLKTAGDLNLPSPAETGTTFLDNARIKAQAVVAASQAILGTKGRVLADDSGLCVPALGGAPGVHSADWEGETRDPRIAMARLTHELRHESDWSAFFVCTLVLWNAAGEERVFEGRCYGTLVPVPRGTSGHGYDPMFVPDGHTRTFAEMTADEKNTLSHRGSALRALRAYFSEKV